MIKENYSYSAVISAPRICQHSSATREGDSIGVQTCRDDDTSVSDAGSEGYKCRGSFLAGKGGLKRKKRRNKAKISRRDMYIGTWNMQTMLSDSHIDLYKLDLLIEEMKIQKLNILGLCETRWSGEGCFKRGDYEIHFSGNSKGGLYGVAIILDKHHAACVAGVNYISDRIMTIKLNTKHVPMNVIHVYAPTSASSPEDIELFYNDLQNIIDRIPKREICMMTGDLNAKVGEGKDLDSGVGAFGHGKRNERGDMLSTFCQVNDFVITNTLFNHPLRKRYTWVSPLDQSRHQIDYILVNKFWKNIVIDSKTMPGADANTDHLLVKARVRLKAMKGEKKKGPIRFNIDRFEQKEIREEYELETKNRFSILATQMAAEDKCPNEIWEEMKNIYLESAEKILGKKESKKTKPYVSEEILQLSRDKRKARIENKKEEYKKIKKEIRKKIRKEKREWLEQECAKITTANEQRKSKELFQQIKKVKGDKLYSRNQCIKDKDGNTLTDAKDVLNRWHDYGKGLFSYENREDAAEFPTENLEPEPLFDEIDSAIHQLKSGKAPGLDNVPGELLKFSDISSKKALHTLCCKIWKSGTWPTEWKLQEFVMLYKSGDQKNCGNYRTIALISHASKIMLIIILNTGCPVLL